MDNNKRKKRKKEKRIKLTDTQTQTTVRAMSQENGRVFGIAAVVGHRRRLIHFRRPMVQSLLPPAHHHHHHHRVLYTTPPPPPTNQPTNPTHKTGRVSRLSFIPPPPPPPPCHYISETMGKQSPPLCLFPLTFCALSYCNPPYGAAPHTLLIDTIQLTTHTQCVWERERERKKEANCFVT